MPSFTTRSDRNVCDMPHRDDTEYIRWLRWGHVGDARYQRRGKRQLRKWKQEVLRAIPEKFVPLLQARARQYFMKDLPLNQTTKEDAAWALWQNDFKQARDMETGMPTFEGLLQDAHLDPAILGVGYYGHSTGFRWSFEPSPNTLLYYLRNARTTTRLPELCVTLQTKGYKERIVFRRGLWRYYHERGSGERGYKTLGEYIANHRKKFAGPVRF